MAKSPKDVEKILHDKAVKADNRSARVGKAVDYLETVFDALIDTGDFISTEDKISLSVDIRRDNLNFDPSAELEQVQILLQVKYGFADWRDLKLVIREKSKGLLTLELSLYKPFPTQALPASADISSLMRIGGRPVGERHEIPGFVKSIAERAARRWHDPTDLSNTAFYQQTK